MRQKLGIRVRNAAKPIVLAMAVIDPSPVTETEKCPLCDTPLAPGADHCIRCDWVRAAEYRRDAGNIEGRDLAAACLSLVPGLGHLYKGHKLTGWLFLLGTLVAIFACAVIATFTMGLGLLILPVYWLFVIFQAYWIEDYNVAAPPTGRDFPA